MNMNKTRYKTIKDIPYRPAAMTASDSYMQERCKLDLYVPLEDKGFATLVWFYGGGLQGGEKEIPAAFMEKGMAVVAVDYRLNPKVKCPAYIEDAAAAVAWIFKNIAEYGGSTKRIFVGGHSAGGYLSGMIGLDKKWLAADGVDANEIAGLILFSGQAITHLTVRAERGIGMDQPVVDEYAPLFHVRADAPPLLLITGDRNLEMIGRYEENAYLMRMMLVNGHKNTTLFELQGYGHLMFDPACPLLLSFITGVP